MPTLGGHYTTISSRLWLACRSCESAMWRVWAPTGQQTCTRVPQSALLMPPGHLLARVLVGGRRRAAVALRRAALQARGRPLGARMHFAVAGHGAFCFAVTLGK